MYPRRTTIAALALILTACGSDSSTEPNTPSLPVATSLQILDPGLVRHGDDLPLRAEVRDQRGRAMTGARIQWSTAHPEIAVVNAEGKLFAMREGITELIAVHGTLTQRRALSIARRPAARYDVAMVNGQPLPVVLEETIDSLPDGRTERLITRLEGGTMTIDGGYRVTLRIAAYHRDASNGVVSDRLVGRQTVTDHGMVSYRTPAGDAALYSEAVGNLMHWLTPRTNGPLLSFTLGGTNSTIGLEFASLTASVGVTP